MRINFNHEAIFAWNQNRLHNLAARRSVERLSSGLKINHGSDDPSGTAISAGAKSQVRGISTAIHNAEEHEAGNIAFTVKNLGFWVPYGPDKV